VYKLFLYRGDFNYDHSDILFKRYQLNHMLENAKIIPNVPAIVANIIDDSSQI